MLKTISETLLKRSVLNRTTPLLNLSTAALPNPQERLQTFRTSEDNPVNHTNHHLGQFYKLPENDKKKLFTHGGLTKLFEIQAKTFTETCIMVREPALDIINYIKAIDLEKPAVRFVLYGNKGCGKSVSLAHVVHYGMKDKFLLVHVPWVGNWMRRPRETSGSESKEGMIDLNLDAAAWLLHFKMQNAEFLSQPEMITSEEQIWSKRESTPKGSPLLNLIEHGINRIKYASNCVDVLTNEIKKLTNAGVCKTLVAIDGYNAFFYPNTRVLTEKKEVVHPHRVTLTSGFLNLTKFDWKNAVIVVTVDEIAIAAEDHKSHLPRFLLGKDGFEHMDPFIPVPVNNYSPKEFTSCMDYFRDRKWVQPFPGQDDELAFITARNPYDLMGIATSL